MVWGCGTEYRGNWNNDFMSGHGVLICSNGNTFKGEWVENYLTGKGELKQEGIFEYNGNFKNT